ncbi:hypothetical protein CFP56_015328 [Quercus suber]|uniref:Uncharacterized protein n=1 Tax=Quercus suber TaxID=58331 RepID=A0AAW0KSU8_QUESU
MLAMTYRYLSMQLRGRRFIQSKMPIFFFNSFIDPPCIYIDPQPSYRSIQTKLQAIKNVLYTKGSLIFLRVY